MNFEDINLQEIENALNPLPPGTVPEAVVRKQDLNQDKAFESQRSNAKKLLFKREIVDRSKLLNEHIFKNNLNPKNHFGKVEIQKLQDTKLKLLKKRDLAEQIANAEGIIFDNSMENKEVIERNKRDLNIIKKTFNILDQANKPYPSEAQQEKNVLEDLNVVRQTFDVIQKANQQANKQRRNKRQVGETEQCELGKILYKDIAMNNAQPIAKDQNNKNRFNKIRNKRSAHPYGHDDQRCQQFILKREKRDPRFRKDRLSTKKKKRTTCPFFARTKLQYNCTACANVFSIEGRNFDAFV